MVRASFVLALSVVCARTVCSVKRGKVQVKGTKGHRSRLLGYITVKRTETLPGRWPIIIYTWLVDSVTLLIRLSSDVAHLRQMELPNTFDFTDGHKKELLSIRKSNRQIFRASLPSLLQFGNRFTNNGLEICELLCDFFRSVLKSAIISNIDESKGQGLDGI